MKCDVLMGMPPELRKHVWELSMWLFEKYGEGLDEEQAQVILDFRKLSPDERLGALGVEYYGMIDDFRVRLGVPSDLVSSIHADNLAQIFNHGS